MTRQVSDEVARKRRELMVRVARSPEFSCCCIRLPREDRRRAKRVFRLTRRLERAWDRERRDTAREALPNS
jgi:glutamate/tyrosine decarboxylase-like PLP-dependent enzyme